MGRLPETKGKIRRWRPKPAASTRERLRWPTNFRSEPVAHNLDYIARQINSSRLTHHQPGTLICSSCLMAPSVPPPVKGLNQTPRYVEHQRLGICFVGAHIGTLYCKAAMLVAQRRHPDGPDAFDSIGRLFVWSRMPRFSHQNPTVPDWEPTITIPSVIDIRAWIPEIPTDPLDQRDWLDHLPESERPRSIEESATAAIQEKTTNPH